MLDTNAMETSQAIRDAMADTQKHLCQHGRGLCDLLEAIDEPAAIDALCDLYLALGKPYPDPVLIAEAMHCIKQTLASQSPSSLDRLGRELNFYAADATRWHGARMSELMARF